MANLFALAPIFKSTFKKYKTNCNIPSLKFFRTESAHSIVKWSNRVPVSAHVLLGCRLKAASHAEVLTRRVVVVAEVLLEPVIVVAVENLATPYIRIKKLKSVSICYFYPSFSKI